MNQMDPGSQKKHNFAAAGDKGEHLINKVLTDVRNARLPWPGLHRTPYTSLRFGRIIAHVEGANRLP